MITLTLKGHDNHRMSKCEHYNSLCCTIHPHAHAATASGPTGAGGQSTFANTGIPTIIGAFVAATGSIIGGLIARNVCCSNKCKCKYSFNSFSYYYVCNYDIISFKKEACKVSTLLGEYL